MLLPSRFFAIHHNQQISTAHNSQSIHSLSLFWLQIKHGNYPERPKTVTNEALSNAAIDFAETRDVLADKSLADLDKLEDDVDEDTLEHYRRRRLEELKRTRERYKFGDVVHISRDEYVNEVTNASKSYPDSAVVIHLYDESKPVCVLINRALTVVARRNGDVKFCKGVGSDVIANFPSANCPTVLVYKNGDCVHHLMGGKIWGGDGVTPDIIEWVLWKEGVISRPVNATDEDPRGKRKGRTKHSYTVYGEEKESSESDEETRGYSSLQLENALRLK